MKKVVIGALATFLFMLLLSSVALAAGYLSTPTYAPGQTSPHSGYASTGNTCKVCHAVHDATSGGQVLLRSSVANSCNYCHVGVGSFSTKRPYGTDPANYTTDYRWNHSSIGYASIENADAKASFSAEETAACTNCHSVHGANAYTIGTTTIAKKDPGVAGGPVMTANGQENIFCANCHRRNHYSTSYNGAAPANYFGVSHVMAAIGGGGGTKSWSNPSITVANTATSTCSSCHKVGDGSDRGAGTAPDIRNFPHWTPINPTATNGGAWEFLDITYYGLDTGTTSTNKLDKVCLNCHTDSVTFGVGYTF